MRALVVLALLAGCGKHHARHLCRDAAERLEQCEKAAGAGALDLPNAPDDISACAANAEHVEMLETCLEASDCDAFVACLTKH